MSEKNNIDFDSQADAIAEGLARYGEREGKKMAPRVMISIGIPFLVLGCGLIVLGIILGIAIHILFIISAFGLPFLIAGSILVSKGKKKIKAQKQGKDQKEQGKK